MTKTILDQMIVMLDRDGTINRNYKEGPVYHPDLFELLPQTAQGIRLLNELGVRVVVVTNQGGINHKERDFDWPTYRKIEQMMHAALKQANAFVDDVFICHHADYEHCICRKPATGMFEAIMRKYEFIAKKSYIVGDSQADIIAGKKFGLQTILVESGWDKIVAQKLATQKQSPDYIFADLYQASMFIREKTNREILPK